MAQDESALFSMENTVYMATPIPGQIYMSIAQTAN